MTNDLIEVDIRKGLIYLSIPLILGGLLESMYNLFDMLWLAGLSEQAVSAAGLGGMFIWLAQGVMMFFKVGSQVLVSQYSGAKKIKEIQKVIHNSFRAALLVGIIYATILFVFSDFLISLFGITGSLKVDTLIYTRIMAIGLPSYFILSTYTGIYNGLGKTKIPFICAAIGLGFNIVLDPILIYNFNMGIAGAAIASAIAFNVDILCFVIYRKWKFQEMPKVRWFAKWDTKVIKDIFRIGFPPAMQSIFFTLISMVITGMVTPFGPQVLGAQRVGVSIESLCFLAARAIQTALSTFVGQNYGAKAYERIDTAFKITCRYGLYYGIFMNVILFFFAREIFSIFAKEGEFLYYGILYLQIISLSQIATMLEGVLAGYFSGFGYTKIPSMVGIIGNFIRIPLAFILSRYYGIHGIWFAITISSVFKGLVLFILAKYYRRTDREMKKRKNEFLSAI